MGQAHLNAQQKLKQLERAEPIDRLAHTVKGSLDEMKTGLASDTNVENMVAWVTSRYLQKYAEDDTKNDIDNTM